MTWIWLLTGCLTISIGEHADRIDQDGDGFTLDDDCDDADALVTVPQWYVDADGDGWGDVEGARRCEQPARQVALTGDCDDGDPDINPEAAEYCDGIDNDCDGATDDDGAVDASPWFPDEDGDGYGDPDGESVRCAAGSGWVSNDGDCDDTLRSVSPAEREVCDGVDTDCSGVADDVRWWFDADGDGYGDLAQEVIQCEAPEGYVAYGDCDDTDPQVHPGADEWCYDDQDNDCDDQVDEDAAVDAPSWYRDADADGYGRLQDRLEACEQPLGYADNSLDCDDDDGDQHPGAAETWYDGVDQDCDGGDDYDADGDGHRSEPEGYGADCDDTDAWVSPDASEACGDALDNDCDGESLGACALEGDLDLVDAAVGIWRGSSAQAHLGVTVDALGDLDGDGSPDFSLGRADGVYLMEGGLEGTDTVDPATHLAVCYDGCTDNGSGGRAAPAGDLDGDGVGDVWVLPGQSSTGAYLVSGAVSAAVDVWADGVPTYSWNGEASFSVLSAGHDADGDGIYDLAVSGLRGPAYVFLAPQAADRSASDADVRISYGGDSEDYFGRSMTWVGDMDGDGLAELAVGASFSHGGLGSVYLFPGADLTDGVAEDLGIPLLPAASGSPSYTGASLADAGDTDGDGLAELLVGSNDDGVSLVRDLAAATLPDDAAAFFDEGSRTGRSGRGVGSAGDVDGDGLPDLLIGDWALQDEVGWSYGGAVLFLSPCEGTLDSTHDSVARLMGEDGSAYGGDAVGTVGDVNGDGFSDFVVGAYGQDHVASQAGAAYLLLGGVD